MKTYLFIVFLVVIFTGCSKNELDEEVQKEVNHPAEVYVYYKPEGSSNEKPDINAKIYLYYDINITSDLGSRVFYEGNGVFRYGNDIVVMSDASFSTDYLGRAVFEVEYAYKKLSIMIESCYYPDMRSYTVYMNSDDKIKLTCIIGK